VAIHRDHIDSALIYQVEVRQDGPQMGDVVVSAHGAIVSGEHTVWSAEPLDMSGVAGPVSVIALQ
jgi:hypothetical protein